VSDSVLWALSILGILIIPVLVLVIRRQLAAMPSSPAGDNASSEATVQSFDPSESSPQKTATSQLGVVDSLEVIATLTLDDQVELSEACIRIKILLDHYDAELIHQAPYSVYATVYNALAHMPTHSARRQTNKKFLMKLDQQRFEIEARNREAVREASRALLDHLSERKTHG